ncbi:hypothetical protein HYPSUDRAFT_75808 [Hypholoma sublateritium FD-334 SS-4]|uniref:Uncharacterized protein n=1 Tax=Hypholoma sublateritium (strain FD-334 SS-4) TaxID=945553 RepID=A0A0D2P4F6_HYPSF|nr:hypothetical protein HYPSUDRAFT_75808 [Hypholoma sublateritium FD-334 SS-4]
MGNSGLAPKWNENPSSTSMDLDAVENNLRYINSMQSQQMASANYNFNIMWRRYLDSDYIVNCEIGKAGIGASRTGRPPRTTATEGVTTKMNMRLASMDEEKLDSLSRDERSQTRISRLESDCSELRSENTELRSEIATGKVETSNQILIVRALQEQVDNLLDYQNTTVTSPLR